MFKTASGVTIPFTDKIKEEFEVSDRGIAFNMSIEKLGSFLCEFLDMLTEPMFFVLEVPLNQNEEEKLRKDDTYPFHKKVCYLDGQSKEQIKSILNQYGELLLNDGILQFAFYSHDTMEGIYIRKYKLAYIFSQNPSRHFEMLQKYGIVQTDKLVTVWDTFTHEAPGQARSIKVDSIDAYILLDELKKLGMYEAKVIGDR